MQENKPNAKRLIDALRQVGYDNYTAIADLVDNSLDAYASRVMVDIGELQGGGHLLVIADNGQGMDAETLAEAVKLGSLTEKDEQSDLGKYGMGMITASISIGEKLVVITKQGDTFMTAIHDVEQIKRQNEFVVTVRPSNEVEKKQFEQRLGGARNGTVLLISNLDQLQNRSMPAFKTILIKRIGETFREFINAGKKIYVGNKEVSASDPLMLEVEGTVTLIDEEKEFDGGVVRIRAVALPRMSQAESKVAGINIPNQGFYLMRNNRQIARAESLGVNPLKHNDYNRFRAEIFFPATLDKIMGVTFTKNGISIKTLDDTLKNWVDHLVQPQLLAIKHQAKKDKVEESEEVIDHEGSQRTFQQKSKLLPDTLPVDTPVTEIEKVGDAGASWTRKSMGRLGPIFEYESMGRKVAVTYNTQHPFYELFVANSDNKDLTEALDFLTYSVAAGLTRISSPENEDLIDTFLDTFSDSLRTLLN